MDDILRNFMEISEQFRSRPFEERLAFISENRDKFYRIKRDIETDLNQINRKINRQRFINEYLIKLGSIDKAKIITKSKMTIHSEEPCSLCSEPHLNQDTVYSSCCERQYGKECFRTWAAQCMKSAPESSTTSDCANHIRCPNCRHANPTMKGFKCRATTQTNQTVIHVSREVLRQPTEDLCSICFDMHLLKDTFQTSCGHKIGKKCFGLWKKRCTQSRVVMTCPVCRTKKPKTSCFKIQPKIQPETLTNQAVEIAT